MYQPMISNLDISVLIATYNRAETLRKTLESMARLDRDGLSVEFVIVDNNSSDHTKKVVESFTNRLPIRYLFEQRQGFNCAVNRALSDAELGRLVVTTGDDMHPRQDWLQVIKSVSERWPDHQIFGGKIYPLWPDVAIPSWAQSHFVQVVTFADHDYSDSECLYRQDAYPFGGNLWFRREVFADGKRFDERFGPRPGSYIMGSETSFLKQLSQQDYGMVYSPEAVVGHRIQPEQISVSNVLKRAYRCGRQGPHLGGLCRRSLFEKHPVFWLLIRIGCIVRASFQYLKGMACPSEIHSVEMKITSLIDIGYNTESLKLAWQETRKEPLC